MNKTEKLRAVSNAYQGATATLDEVSEVELQLLDALLEQKRVRASLSTP